MVSNHLSVTAWASAEYLPKTDSGLRQKLPVFNVFCFKT
jgi:hypothetical protein